MNNPTEQDSQVPTHDEPPPKQYATEQSASAAPRGKDESSPKIPVLRKKPGLAVKRFDLAGMA
jgi:hypothetical protein